MWSSRIVIRVAGIVGRTVTTLIGATALIIGLATWLVFGQIAEQERRVRLQDIENRTALRSTATASIFADIARQLRLARALFERQLLLDHDSWRGIPKAKLGIDGARRLLPAEGDPPLAAFIASGIADDSTTMRHVGNAVELLLEHGESWCEIGGSMSIAQADRWYAGYGIDAGELVSVMLPNDPILLPEERHILGGAGRDLVWPPAQLEPASGRYHLGAYALSNDGETSFIRQLRLEDVLTRAADFQLPAAETLIVDRNGRILARGGEDQGWHSDAQLLSDSADPALRGLATMLDFDGPASEVLRDEEARWFYGISRLPGPGWAMISIHPAEIVDAPARSIAGLVMLIGCGLLALQATLLLLIMQRRIARPLGELVSAAEHIAAGDRGLALATDRQDELGELARAFTRMDQSISDGEARLRSANEALREREELARALVESAADAVLLLHDGRIAEANPRAGELFGCQPSTLIDSDLLDWAPAKQANERMSSAVHNEKCRLAAQGQTCQYAWSARRQDGHRFEAEIGLARVDLPGPQRLLAVVRDVTERNRLQREMRQGEKMESVGQLAGGIAHDFNNMLSVILGAAEMLEEPSVDAEARERLIDSIIGTCERAGGLVGRLLSFARRSDPLTTTIDIHKLLEDVLTLLERSIDRRIDLQRDLGAVNAAVIGDGSQLENAFLNLGLNARDAMPDGGRLRFETHNVDLDGSACELPSGQVTPGPYLRIDIQDSGVGIPTEIIDRVFEPFFTTKPVGKGTGLGLAAVYRAMVDHGGGIEVDSDSGSGTTFRCYLPLSDREVVGQVTASTHPVHLLQGHTVLLVDDEDMVRIVARQILESFGMAVLEAEDGHRAVERFREERQRIDIVLLDAEMPGLRGPDCLKALREIDPSVKAVLCSGFIRLRSQSELQQAGFQDQLNKPYRMQQMRNCIEGVLFGEDD